jgi:predicted DNA-binding transcriptional regulator YafY
MAMAEVDDGRTLSIADKKRLAPDRFRRIWQLVEEIAREPGRTRRQLAAEYALSERQIQSDLNVIRSDMSLPLVRRQGYRFRLQDESGEPPFTLAEAQLLLALLRRATRDPSLPADRMRSLMDKLPQLFPPHLRPMVEKTLEAFAADPTGRQHNVFTALADALLRKASVKLHYPSGDPATSLLEPIVQPEVLFPFMSSWYVIGPCRQRGRVMVFDLESVVAVTQATGL